MKDNLEFESKGEFISALYESSKHEYLPLGFIGEKEKTTLVSAVTDAVGGVVNVTEKLLTTVGNALTLSDTAEEASVDFQNVLFLNNKLSKKQKLVIKPDTVMIVIHQK